MHAELALSTCGRQAERRALTTFAATSGAAAAGRVGACRGAWRGAAACGRPGRPARGRRSRGRRRGRPCGRRGGRGGRRRRARCAPGGRERRAGGPGCRALPWPCRRPWPLPERRRIGRPPGGAGPPAAPGAACMPQADPGHEAAPQRTEARGAQASTAGQGRGRAAARARPRGACAGALAPAGCEAEALLERLQARPQAWHEVRAPIPTLYPGAALAPAGALARGSARPHMCGVRMLAVPHACAGSMPRAGRLQGGLLRLQHPCQPEPVPCVCAWTDCPCSPCATLNGAGNVWSGNCSMLPASHDGSSPAAPTSF